MIRSGWRLACKELELSYNNPRTETISVLVDPADRVIFAFFISLALARSVLAVSITCTAVRTHPITPHHRACRPAPSIATALLSSRAWSRAGRTARCAVPCAALCCLECPRVHQRVTASHDTRERVPLRGSEAGQPRCAALRWMLRASRWCLGQTLHRTHDGLPCLCLCRARQRLRRSCLGSDCIRFCGSAR